ncbi:Pyruvate/Phosphoenolpyruvate kinase-like domain-containing protein [Aspergillus heterothallicus]
MDDHAYFVLDGLGDCGSDIVIIARTDALAVEGYDAALERLVAARECGADMGFLEAIETEEQIKNAVKVLAPMPLMLAIYPGAAGKSVLHTIRRAYKYLMETGKDDAAAQGLDPRGFFDGMGLQREMEIDRLAGGVSFRDGA